jgi:beta-carotene hydroxylase
MLLTAVEGEAARKLTPDTAWPTLLMIGLLAPLHLALLWLGLTMVSPWWVTVPLGISAYLHYTPLHEAIHRNIVRSSRFDPANRAIGWVGSILLGLTWPQALRTHLAHHAHTNDVQDPDLFIKGSLVRLVGLSLLSVLTNLIPVRFWSALYGKNVPNLGYLDAWKVMRGSEWRTHQSVHALMCLGVWAGVALGHGVEVFALYVLPATLGRFLVGFLLSWLPHQPFIARDRYRSANIRFGRLLQLAAVGHNMHLMHHLWPRVPFYRYAALYRKLEPVLRERGIHIR